jgi:hypothetical protein
MEGRDQAGEPSSLTLSSLPAGPSHRSHLQEESVSKSTAPGPAAIPSPAPPHSTSNQRAPA